MGSILIFRFKYTKRIALWGLFLAPYLTGCLSANEAAYEFRTFTSHDGRQLEAKLITIDTNSVSLEDRGGRLWKNLKWDLFNHTDQQFFQNCLKSQSDATVAFEIKPGQIFGYGQYPAEPVRQGIYGGGFSLYSAVWPLAETYPGNRYQTGLLHTWMFSQYDSEIDTKGMYSCIEGGLGWWRDTRFATETPKFIMGGVALNFSEWANGPGAGKGRDWSKPQGKYAIAQISNRVLWAPDGLNFQQGSCGQLFGYGYRPLPLVEPQETTYGASVPTGNQCWTLFLNTQNFKGPLTFFLPEFFSRSSIKETKMSGQFLDSKPSDPNLGLSMETQYIPSFLAIGEDGSRYAKVAPILFPQQRDRSLVGHQFTVYPKSPLWNAVKRWFDHGDLPAKSVFLRGSFIKNFTGNTGSSWSIYADGTPKNQRHRIDWESFMTSKTDGDQRTIYQKWDSKFVDRYHYQGHSAYKLPEYYQLVKQTTGTKIWTPVLAEHVPPATGLHALNFDVNKTRNLNPYTTPDSMGSVWKQPGPTSGPHTAVLGDGSKLTYYWYRFADQPALLKSSLSFLEREALQQRIELMHRHWPIDQSFIREPSVDVPLVNLDPAIVVRPPAGLEYGYVPIVTNQRWAKQGKALFDDQPSIEGKESTLENDLFSINFFAYGGLAEHERTAVTLEPTESAGYDAWDTHFWQNVTIPWGLAQAEEPIAITSNSGKTAQLVLKNARNGGPFNFNRAHIGAVAGGNGDLMDGHANGTEDPGDGSRVFELALSEIPYARYDLIVYLGANNAQFGDGSGNFVLNDGPSFNFKLLAGEFERFQPIEDSHGAGNVLILKGLTGDCLSFKVWGNGFNHVGPCGFQLAKSGMSKLRIAPKPAKAIFPIPGTRGLGAKVRLKWVHGYGAESNTVYFGKNPALNEQDIIGHYADPSLELSELAQGRYYWRVDEMNRDGVKQGDVWSFIVGPPSMAMQPMPYTGAQQTDTKLKFQWKTCKFTKYSKLYLGNSPDLTDKDLLAKTEGAEFQINNLQADTQYYWRVDTVNEFGPQIGDIWHFTTRKNNAKAAKVYILAGQSNMVGSGHIAPAQKKGTLAYLRNHNPKKYAHLGSVGRWASRDDVSIIFSRNDADLAGSLTVGFGSDVGKIGPEFMFGHVLGDHFEEPVILIKTAWGGKSLAYDFLSPSSGWSGQPTQSGQRGYYFKRMVQDVMKNLEQLDAIFPELTTNGYELAGVVWHQGWNDHIEPIRVQAYENNLKNFIVDLRAALGRLYLPFVAATTGHANGADYAAIELAQLRIADFLRHPDFRENVAVVDTNRFYRDVQISPRNDSSHWHCNAESYVDIGHSLAEAIINLHQFKVKH